MGITRSSHFNSNDPEQMISAAKEAKSDLPWFRATVRRRLFLLATCIAAAIPANAHIHHSSDGTAVSWYPRDCCDDGDCHPISRIITVADGFLMTTEDGATLFVNSRSTRRQSLDNRWHICFGSRENPAIRCIFEPPSS